MLVIWAFDMLAGECLQQQQPQDHFLKSSSEEGEGVFSFHLPLVFQDTVSFYFLLYDGEHKAETIFIVRIFLFGFFETGVSM